MAVKKWRVWVDKNLPKFLSTCDSSDDIILYFVTEFRIHELAENQYSMLDRFNSVKIVLGSYDTDHLPMHLFGDNVEFILVPDIFCYFVGMQPLYTDRIGAQKKKIHYINLNGRASLERATLLDKLAKYEILDGDYFSWNNLLDKWQGKYWRQEINQFTRPGATFKPYMFPKQAQSALVSLVSETDQSVKFITEKTFRSILYKVPVIIYGPKLVNAKLEEMGFKLPRELFNFDFDNIDDTEERADAIAAAMKDFKKNKIKSYIKPLNEIAEHNFKVLVDIMEKQDVPDILSDDDYFKINYFWLINKRIPTLKTLINI